jgi:hypothetical protein
MKNVEDVGDLMGQSLVRYSPNRNHRFHMTCPQVEQNGNDNAVTLSEDLTSSNQA